MDFQVRAVPGKGGAWEPVVTAEPALASSWIAPEAEGGLLL
jgi:hypothetical protein